MNNSNRKRTYTKSGDRNMEIGDPQARQFLLRHAIEREREIVSDDMKKVCFLFSNLKIV